MNYTEWLQIKFGRNNRWQDSSEIPDELPPLKKMGKPIVVKYSRIPKEVRRITRALQKLVEP